MKLKWGQENIKGTACICDTEQMNWGWQKKWTGNRRSAAIGDISFNLLRLYATSLKPYVDRWVRKLNYKMR